MVRAKTLPNHRVVIMPKHSWLKGAAVVVGILLAGAALQKADDQIDQQEQAIAALTRANARMAAEAAARAAVPQIRLEGDKPVCTFTGVREQWLHVISQQCEALGTTLKLARTVP